MEKLKFLKHLKAPDDEAELADAATHVGGRFFSTYKKPAHRLQFLKRPNVPAAEASKCPHCGTKLLAKEAHNKGKKNNASEVCFSCLSNHFLWPS